LSFSWITVDGMLTKSDLEAIGSLMDAQFAAYDIKMEARFTQIDDRFTQIDKKLKEHDHKFTLIFSELKKIKTETRKLRKDLSITIVAFDRDIIRTMNDVDLIKDHLHLA